jgi:glyoxylase-like metal-dependent hydrolase (beta-lactamase superfamily II)
MRSFTRGHLFISLALVYVLGLLVDAHLSDGGQGEGGQRGAGAGRGNQPPAPPPNLIKVKDDIYVIQNANHVVSEIGQNGGNVTFYVTNEGVILIDSKNERMHDDIIAKVKSVTNQPIKYMILTHNHGDHSGGSAKLQTLGVTVVSSVGSRENMMRTNTPGQAHIAYSGYSQVFLGGKELQLREYRGHTRGDTVISFPAARVVVGGDLVTTPDTIPTIVNYGDGGNWTDLGRSLDEVAKMDFDVMIGGHGPNLTKQEFLKYRDQTVAIRERVRALNRERRSQEEIAAALLKEFNWGTGPAAGNIAGMMQELR